jgi:hypothetical protein
MVQLLDRLTLDAPKRTSDGYMAVRAKAARTGVYDYLASEVGAPADKFKPTDRVKVYRDEAEVFAEDSVRSFIGRPITNDHPAEPVTRDNWKQHAGGVVMAAARRKLEDGDYLAFDLVLMDGALIDAVEAGKRELSNGYACDFDWTPGTAPDGTAYDARQTNIRGNHVAVVDRGRAGPSCAIKDGDRFALCDANPAALDGINTKEPAMKIKIGDAEVDATNGEAVRIAVDALNVKLTALDKRAADAEAQVATLTTDKATLEAKVTTLEKQVADAKLTPEQLRDAARSFAQTAAKAKALGVEVSDDMDEPAMRRAAVTAKLGDAAKDWTDDQVAISFATLTADVKDDGATIHDIGKPKAVNDADKDVAAAYDAMVADLLNPQASKAA